VIALATADLRKASCTCLLYIMGEKLPLGRFPYPLADEKAIV